MVDSKIVRNLFFGLALTVSFMSAAFAESDKLHDLIFYELDSTIPDGQKIGQVSRRWRKPVDILWQQVNPEDDGKVKEILRGLGLHKSVPVPGVISTVFSSTPVRPPQLRKFDGAKILFSNRYCLGLTIENCWIVRDRTQQTARCDMRWIVWDTEIWHPIYNGVTTGTRQSRSGEPLLRWADTVEDAATHLLVDSEFQKVLRTPAKIYERTEKIALQRSALNKEMAELRNARNGEQGDIMDVAYAEEQADSSFIFKIEANQQEFSIARNGKGASSTGASFELGYGGLDIHRLSFFKRNNDLLFLYSQTTMGSQLVLEALDLTTMKFKWKVHVDSESNDVLILGDEFYYGRGPRVGKIDLSTGQLVWHEFLLSLSVYDMPKIRGNFIEFNKFKVHRASRGFFESLSDYKSRKKEEKRQNRCKKNIRFDRKTGEMTCGD